MATLDQKYAGKAIGIVSKEIITVNLKAVKNL